MNRSSRILLIVIAPVVIAAGCTTMSPADFLADGSTQVSSAPAVDGDRTRGADAPVSDALVAPLPLNSESAVTDQNPLALPAVAYRDDLIAPTLQAREVTTAAGVILAVPTVPVDSVADVTARGSRPDTTGGVAVAKAQAVAPTQPASLQPSSPSNSANPRGETAQSGDSSAPSITDARSGIGAAPAVVAAQPDVAIAPAVVVQATPVRAESSSSRTRASSGTASAETDASVVSVQGATTAADSRQNGVASVAPRAVSAQPDASSGFGSVAPPASTSAQSSPASASPWIERSAHAASGSEIRVVLPGSGWLYVGTEYGDGDVRLVGKTTSDGDDVFRFTIATAGDYSLWFQQQDSRTGSLTNERLALRVDDSGDSQVRVAALPGASEVSSSSDSAGTATSSRAAPGVSSAQIASGSSLMTGTQSTNAAPGTSSGPAATSSRPAVDAGMVSPDVAGVPSAGDEIVRLLAAGDATEALARAADAIDSADPEDASGVITAFPQAALAALLSAAQRDARYPVVRSFWRAVASSGTIAAPVARSAYLERAIAQRSQPDVAEAISLLEGAGEARSPDYLAAMAMSPDSSDSIVYLAKGVLTATDPGAIVASTPDERLFLLARLLEGPGETRDLQRAASIYQTIIRDRPLSSRWDESNARLEYLRRHYFDVR